MNRKRGQNACRKSGPIRFEQLASSSLAVMNPLTMSGENSRNNKRKRDSQSRKNDQERNIEYQQPPPNQNIYPSTAGFFSERPQVKIPSTVPTIDLNLSKTCLTDSSLDDGFIPFNKNITIDLNKDSTCFEEVNGDCDNNMPIPPNPSNIPYEMLDTEPITSEPLFPLQALPFNVDKVLLDKENHGKDDNIYILFRIDLDESRSVPNTSLNSKEIDSMNESLANDMYDYIYMSQQQQQMPVHPMIPMNPQMGYYPQPLPINTHMNINQHIHTNQQQPVPYTKILPKPPEFNDLPMSNKYYPMMPYSDENEPYPILPLPPRRIESPSKSKRNLQKIKQNDKKAQRKAEKTKGQDSELMLLLKAAESENNKINEQQMKEEKHNSLPISESDSSAKSSYSKSTIEDEDYEGDEEVEEEEEEESSQQRLEQQPPPVTPHYDSGYYPQKSAYNNYIGYMTHMPTQIEKNTETEKTIKRQKISNKSPIKKIEAKKEKLTDIENSQTTTKTKPSSPQKERKSMSPILRPILPQQQQPSYPYPIMENYGMPPTTPIMSDNQQQRQYKLSFHNARPLHEASEQRIPLQYTYQPPPHTYQSPPIKQQRRSAPQHQQQHQQQQQPPPQLPLISPQPPQPMPVTSPYIYPPNPHQLPYSYPPPPPQPTYQLPQHNMAFYPRQPLYSMPPQVSHYPPPPLPPPYYYRQNSPIPIQHQPQPQPQPQPLPPQYLMQNDYYQEQSIQPIPPIPQMQQYLPPQSHYVVYRPPPSNR